METRPNVLSLPLVFQICIPRSPNHSTKRAREQSNSLEMYSRDGKSKRGSISKREEGLPLLLQVPHIPMILKSQIHPRGLLKGYALHENAKGPSMLGEGQENGRSLKEGRTSPSSPIMVLMGRQTRYLPLSKKFNAALGGKYFIEHSKLHHVAMHFQKSVRKWWESLRTQGITPRT